MALLMVDPGRRGGGVDRKRVEGQGPSSLITPMQLQRQKPGAFDTAFMLLLCSFVELRAFCGPATAVSIITSCPAPEGDPIIFNIHFVSLDQKHDDCCELALREEQTSYRNSITTKVPKLSARTPHRVKAN